MIDVDIDQLVPDTISTLIGHQGAEQLLSNIAEAARAKWVSLARAELGPSSREAYINGIQPIEAEEGVRVITLVGWLPNAVEAGMKAFDMRDTLLGPKSRLRRVSASGSVYGHVPFRHTTPGSVGLHGTPMGRSHGPTGPMSRGLGNIMTEQSAKQLGTSIYMAAKRLKKGKRLPAGIGMAPTLTPQPVHRPTGINIHKSDIFAGMVRVRHTYEKATQTKYMTFRTISTSNPEGWHHPGIEARHLAEKVKDYVEEIAPKIIKAAMSEVLK